MGAFVLGNYFTSGAVSGFVRAQTLPVVSFLQNITGGSVGTLGNYFASKQTLAAENAVLKARIEALERATPADRLEAYALASRDVLAETLATRVPEMFVGKEARIADVVSYVNYPFGTLAIYFRTPLSDTAAGQVRYVFSEDGSSVGVLENVSGQAGVVRLFSRAGEEHHMRVGESELALVTGRGGITMETVIPKTVVLHEGDPVSLPEAGNALVGSVGEITSMDTDTTQRVLLRLATSPSTMRAVYIFE